MSRKARGARGRKASEAQMARLRALLQMDLSQPVPFESYRYMMRSNQDRQRNLETELAAWEHLEKTHDTGWPAWWPPPDERAAWGEAER